jgi:cyanophycinase-like exopeptidase
MNGYIALVGSGEYLPVMDGVDRYLLAHCVADERTPRVVCLPTAAGQEGDASVNRWMKMGLDHFHLLGADVQAIRITERSEADDPRYAGMLARADLIYFSGGNPAYLYRTMQGSKAWQAAEQAWERGAAYAGCSAGAMILGRELPDLRGGTDRGTAFGKVPARYIIPHFDRMQLLRPVMTPLMKSRLQEGEFSLGIDEETALVGKLGGEWQAMGRSKVYVFTRQEVKSYSDGDVVPFPA